MCDLLWSDPDDRCGWGISPRGAGAGPGTAPLPVRGPPWFHNSRASWQLHRAARPSRRTQRKAAPPPRPPYSPPPRWRRLHLWPGHQRAVQPHQWPHAGVARAPACDGGLQLVPRAERGHHLLCPQLLLPVGGRSGHLPSPPAPAPSSPLVTMQAAGQRALDCPRPPPTLPRPCCLPPRSLGRRPPAALQRRSAPLHPAPSRAACMRATGPAESATPTRPPCFPSPLGPVPGAATWRPSWKWMST